MASRDLEKATVLILVANTVRQDPRVVRQLECLLDFGCDVTVLGQAETAFSETFTYAGAQVHLVPGQKRAYREVMWSAAIAALLAAVLMVALLVAVPVALSTKIMAATIGLAPIGLLVAALEAARRRSNQGMRKPRAGRMRDALAILFRRFADWRLSTRMIAAAQKLGPFTIVHAHEPDTLPAATCLRDAFGAWLIYDSHELYPGQSGATHATIERYDRIMTRCAASVDRLVAVSDSMGDALRERHPALPPALSIVNSGARSAGEVYDGRLHARCEVAADNPILLFQGGLSENRGLEVLCLAAEFLAPAWSVAIIGDGPLRPHLEAIPNAGRVRFLGQISSDELPLWTQGAELGYIGYEPNCDNHRVCLPNKVWEYAACSVPSLVGDLPEVRSITQRFRSGFLAPEKSSPQQLAAFVNGLTPEALVDARKGASTLHAGASSYGMRPVLKSLYESLMTSSRTFA